MQALCFAVAAAPVRVAEAGSAVQKPLPDPTVLEARAAALRVAGDDPQALHQVLRELARYYYRNGNFDRAAAVASEMVTRASERGDRLAEGKARITLAWITTLRGNHTEARDQFAETLVLARTLKDPGLEADSLDGMGYCEMWLGDFARASALLDQSLAVARRSGNTTDISDILSKQGDIALRQGEYDRAVTLYEQALVIDRANNDVASLAFINGSLGRLYSLRHDYERALALGKESVAQATRAQHRLRLAASHARLGSTYADMGRHAEAIAEKQQALQIFNAAGIDNWIGQELRDLGQIHTATRQFALARRYLSDAREAAVRAGRRQDEAEALLRLGELAEAEQQNDAALDAYRRALALWQSDGSRNGFMASQVLNRMGLVEERRNHLDEARAHFRLARLADPKNGVAVNNFIRIGRLLSEQIRTENTREADRFCRVADESAAAVNLTHCGIGLLLTGDSGRALGYVTRAIERAQLPGERAFAWYARGSTLSALDRPGEARAAFRTALGFDPPRSLQADIHFALGILENSQQELSQARQLDPTIAQVSSVANLNTRHRQVRLTVTGQGSQGAIQQDLYVPPIYRRLLINGEPVLFLVDTGAAYTLLNRESRERVRLQPTPDTLLVSYADGRQERLVRYRPRSIALPGERPRPLRTNWMLGTPGRDNLLGRDLLSQIVSNRWFTEARGR